MLELVGQGDYLLPRANSVGRGRERGGERRGERRDGEETVREEKWGRKGSGRGGGLHEEG